jgi:hypothetical protein
MLARRPAGPPRRHPPSHRLLSVPRCAAGGFCGCPALTLRAVNPATWTQHTRVGSSRRAELDDGQHAAVGRARHPDDPRLEHRHPLVPALLRPGPQQPGRHQAAEHLPRAAFPWA